MLEHLLRPRICELGKIKIGGKGAKQRTAAGKEWRLPVKYDHFVITTLNKSKDGDLEPDNELMERLAPKYGSKDGKLRQLPIAVLSDDIEDILQASYVAYAGKRLAARSDGQTVEWFARDGKWLSEPIVENWNPDLASKKDAKGNRLFKMHANLNVVIASEEARLGGVYKFRTTSQISTEQIYGSLLHIKELTNGVLNGLPLMLIVRPLQVTPEGKPTTVYIVHVELRGSDLMSVQEMASRLLENKLKNARAIEQNKIAYRQLLLPPGYESEEVSADIVEEFHPEQQLATSDVVIDAEVVDAVISKDDGKALIDKMKECWGNNYKTAPAYKKLLDQFGVKLVAQLKASDFEAAMSKVVPVSTNGSNGLSRKLVASTILETINNAESREHLEKARTYFEKHKDVLSIHERESYDSMIDNAIAEFEQSAAEEGQSEVDVYWSELKDEFDALHAKDDQDGCQALIDQWRDTFRGGKYDSDFSGLESLCEGMAAPR